ncbi:MAG: GGDEF domain-containing protein [Planctomycetes bacterium]|nr:GGDEF domain-containing protein [Planctomycetota bacterium]
MDEPTVLGKQYVAGPPTEHVTSGLGDMSRPQRGERKLLLLLLPLFALAAGTAWAEAELQGSAHWYERYVLLPSSFAFLALLVWNYLLSPARVALVRNATLVVGPGIVLVGWGRQLWDLHYTGFDHELYFDIAPWLIFCSVLFLFLLPGRLSWRFAAGYYVLTLLMLGIFLAVHRESLPTIVVNEFSLNIVIAPPVFIVLTSAFTRLRADYARARTHAEDLQEMAMLDGLTRLPNRRAFAQSFKRAKARQLRSKTPLCVMLIDIDHFKRVNDTYGHQVGDEVLVGLANILLRELRGTDEVFRWGGEEFMVLLEETPQKHLAEVAERLRAAVEAANLLERSTLTISIGATHIGVNEGEDVVYPRADEALYASKRDGRNRVTIAELADKPAPLAS